MSDQRPVATLLLVDDEPANTELLEAFLEDEGYQMYTVNDARLALDTWRRVKPDLLLLDLHMPYIDGFAVMEQVGGLVPADEYFPILVLTADVTSSVRERALAGGAKDFLTKPLDAVEVQLRVRNLLETRRLHLRQQEALLAAEEAERRSMLLAEASHRLSSSLDSSTALASLTHLTVDHLSDFCALSLFGADGCLEVLVTAHRDPTSEPTLRRVAELGFANGMEGPIARVVVAGEPILIARVDTDALGALGLVEILNDLSPTSLICVPLCTADAVLGAMVLGRCTTPTSYGVEELRIARELARRATLAVENARLYNAAQQAVGARDQVLAVVAHDLRNPLSTVSMGTDALLESLSGPSYGTETRYLTMIRNAARRMDGLIQDLLDLTRVESGQLHIEPHAQPLSRIVRETVDMIRLAAAGAQLEVEIDETLPLLLIDPPRIQQVLSNLLGNALKFSPPGEPIVVRARRQDDGGALISVEDHGPGIAAEQIPHVFARFWQGKRTDRRGVGLGLAISKGIVEAHGGSIWVESDPGLGSRFYFTLRPAVPESTEPEARQESRAELPPIALPR